MHFFGGGGYLAMYTTIVQMAAEPEAIEQCFSTAGPREFLLEFVILVF